MQPVDRVAVCPLQVVDHHNEGRRGANRSSERLEKAEALPALEMMIWRREVGTIREERGAKPRDIAHRRRVERKDSCSEGIAGEPPGDWSVREAALARVTPRGCDGHIVEARPVRELFGEPRLSDARLAADQEKVWRSGIR